MKKQTVLLLMPLLLSGSLVACKNKKQNSSSSSDTSVPTVVDKKVNQQEYLKAFENVANMKNGSIEYSLDQSSYSGDGSLASMRMGGIKKIDNGKYSKLSTFGLVYTFDQVYFANLYKEKEATTDEQKKAIYDDLLDKLNKSGYVISETKENYIEAGRYSEPEENFAEANKENSEFVYDYVETDYEDNQYYKSRVFVEESDVCGVINLNAIVSLFGNEETYKNLTYNETTGNYTLNATDEIYQLFTQLSLEDELDSMSVTFTFADKQLTDILISAYVDEDNVKETFKFFNVNSTDVYLPTNIVTCDHENTSGMFYASVDDYHYSYCSVCNAVVEYEKHSFYHDYCTYCGHTDDREEICYDLGLEDEHMNSHFYYYVTKNGQFDGISSYGLSRDYDRDIGGYVRTCTDEECSLKIIETETERQDTENKCIKIVDTKFEVYVGDSETPVKTINLTEYKRNHKITLTTSTNPENPCQEIYTETCEECGITTSYVRTFHEFDETYSGDGCYICLTKTCEKCSKTIVEKKHVHKDLVIGEKDGDNYQCHCNECNEDFVCNIEFEASSSYYHNVTNNTTEMNTSMPHIFDENGCCTLCGYEKTEGENEAEWIHCGYGGIEYIYFVKNSEGKYISMDSCGFEPTVDGNVRHFTARYSEYNYDLITNNNPETGTSYDVIVRKGDTVIFECSY